MYKVIKHMDMIEDTPVPLDSGQNLTANTCMILLASR